MKMIHNVMFWQVQSKWTFHTLFWEWNRHSHLGSSVALSCKANTQLLEDPTVPTQMQTHVHTKIYLLTSITTLAGTVKIFLKNLLDVLVLVNELRNHDIPIK